MNGPNLLSTPLGRRTNWLEENPPSKPDRTLIRPAARPNEVDEIGFWFLMPHENSLCAWRHQVSIESRCPKTSNLTYPQSFKEHLSPFSSKHGHLQPAPKAGTRGSRGKPSSHWARHSSEAEAKTSPGNGHVSELVQGNLHKKLMETLWLESATAWLDVRCSLKQFRFGFWWFLEVPRFSVLDSSADFSLRSGEEALFVYMFFGGVKWGVFNV